MLVVLQLKNDTKRDQLEETIEQLYVLGLERSLRKSFLFRDYGNYKYEVG